MDRGRARRRDAVAARHAALACARGVGRARRAGRSARAGRVRGLHRQPLPPDAPRDDRRTASSRFGRWTRSWRRASSTRPTSGSRSTTSSSASTCSGTSRRRSVHERRRGRLTRRPPEGETSRPSARREGHALGTFGSYQNEIYLAGLGDVVPELPADLTRLEAIAEERMPATAFGYVAGSAGSEATARANRAAFDAWRIVPRMLRDVSAPDLSVSVLGTPMPAPVALAPVGVLGIVHPDGEAAVAVRQRALGVPMVVSTAASTTLEDVAAAGGDTPRWYQLYWPKDRDWWSASSSARPPPGTARSSSRSTPMRWGGGRATSTTPSCRSSAQSATRTTSPIPSSSARWAAPSTTRTGSRRSSTGPPCSGPGAHLGRPRLSAGALERADRAQGDPASGRCAARGRRRDGRRRRLEPRRPAGRRRRRRARRPAGDRRRGRRPDRGADGQRHPVGRRTP